MSSTEPSATPSRTVIEPGAGWRGVDVRQLWDYRELLWFLALRDYSVRYKQTVLGWFWGVLQPLALVLVFTVFFGRVIKVPSDGLPYPVFAMSGVLVWTLFAGCLDRSAGAALAQAHLIGKIYFPRLVVPLSSALVTVPDALLSGVVMVALAFFLRAPIGPGALLVPVVLVVTMAGAIGFGLWISAATIRYRDLRHALGLGLQLWMYASPVIYPVEVVTRRMEDAGVPGWLYGLNPAAGLIALTRGLLFAQVPIPGPLVAVSMTVCAAVLVTGALLFRRAERTMVDVL